MPLVLLLRLHAYIVQYKLDLMLIRVKIVGVLETLALALAQKYVFLVLQIRSGKDILGSKSQIKLLNPFL